MKRLIVAGSIVLSVAVTPSALASEDACTELARTYNVMLSCPSVGDVVELIARTYN